MKYLYSHKVNAIITPRNVYTWTGLLSVPGFYCKPNPRKNSFFAPILLHDYSTTPRNKSEGKKINCHDFISVFPKYPIPSKTTALDPAAKGWTSFLTVSWQFFSFQLDKSSSLAHNSCVGYDKKDLNNFYLFVKYKEWKKSFSLAFIISYFFFLSFFSGSHQPLGMEPRSYLRGWSFPHSVFLHPHQQTHFTTWA